MKAYYGSRISPNQTETNEGYLIAHNVPVARTGYQDYLGSEIGLSHDDKIKVSRDHEEVFSPQTIASFEGKAVTNDHPPVALDANNTRDYQMGYSTNVRRGKGADSDLLLADLILTDKRLIDAVRNGKREVSAGYECDYVPLDDGNYAQKNIRGNHIAVVDQGRAGHRVRISDRRTVDFPDEKAEQRSKKYGISVKKDGHRSPPKDYPSDPNEYGDPVNYKYPIDKEHIQAAVEYYQHKGNHADGDYSNEEWEKIGKRITEAANRLLHEGHEYKGGDITNTKQTSDSKGGTRMQIKLPRRGGARVKDVLAAAGLKIFAMDAEPEEVQEAVDALVEENREEEEGRRDDDGGDNGEKTDTKDDGDSDRIKTLEDKVAELTQKLEDAKKTKDEKTAEEVLDEEIAQMEDPEDASASSTIDDGDDVTTDEPGPVSSPEDRPHSGITGDSARAVLQSLKPIIAAIPDEKTRRQVVDTAIASLKGRSGKNVYGQMARDTKNKVKQRQASQQQQVTIDHGQLGEDIRNKWNPHYMNKQN